MSWKSLVCAGLVCVLASPVFAAPTLKVRDGGLDGGNRVWNVTVAPETGPSSLAVELGFDPTGATIVSATSNADWEDDGVAPVGNPGNNPFSGSITNGITVGAGGANVFAALGSTNLLNGSSNVLTIKTSGPIALLDLAGIYGAGSNQARIAEDGTNFDYSGKFGVNGDFDLNGKVDVVDFGVFGDEFGKTGQTNNPADFDGNGNVDVVDFGVFGDNFGLAIPAAAAGSVAGVPEPTSMFMVIVGMIAGATMLRRKRTA